jgi:flagellar FliL protein
MKKKSLITMIIALLLGIGLGVGGLIGAQKFIFKSTPTAAVKVQTQPGPLISLGDFTVNLQGGAYLKTSITVEVTDAKAETSVKAEVPFLQDRVNTVLSNKSLTDVQTQAAREKLRQDLIKQLNQVADNQITDVLFLSMVYQ